MLFNSYVFIFLFLPIVWCVYFFLNRFRLCKLAQVSLVLASFCFYGYEDVRLCLLLLVTIVVNYIFHFTLVRVQNKNVKRVLLVFGILLNITLLFYFKYLNFTFGIIFGLLGRDFVTRNIVLPLGISFFTFQQISMLIDSSRPDMVKYRFWDYALFVSFFPQLIAGPIVLHKEMIPQFGDPEKKKIQPGNMISGIEYFVLGFAKKVLVADMFARICDAGYENLAELNVYSSILTILAFTLQIYFDFSGYCDMAKGLGKMFNIEIPINFNSPYKALNIADFWRRWHMTLTRFLTQYLYIPLGGSRKGVRRTYINIMIVFAISGLWHGADWTFILWGMMHGAMQVVYRVGKKVIDRWPKWIQWMMTFAFVNVAWVFFRAESTAQLLGIWKGMTSDIVGWCQNDMIAAVCDSSICMALTGGFVSAEVFAFVKQIWVLLVFFVWIVICIAMPSSHEIVERKNRNNWYFVGLGICFFWSFVSLSQISKFIYFNF